jgi:hypothetical protein
MPTLEVRCCCNPTRLIGHLEVAADTAHKLAVVMHIRDVPNDRPGSFQLPAIRRAQLDVVFQLGQYVPLNGPPYLALKAPHDVDEALLLLLPGFTIAKR